jgi:hypothetical protein
VRLEPREERERHDERRDAERKPEKRRERDDSHLRVAPRREEISLGKKERNQEKKIFLEGEEGDGRLLTLLSIFVFLLVFRPHQREQDDIPNGGRVREEHGEAVDADAFARRRRHAV